MNNNTRLIIISVVVFAILVALVVVRTQSTQPSSNGTPVATAVVSYACDSGKTINATYYNGPSTPAASTDQPPTPGGSVALTLSDGRTMTLPQTISADGARYANTDESFVFWNKGNGATVTEASQPTFIGCIQVAGDTGGLTEVYQNSAEGFTLRYPTGFTPDSTYKYQALGPGKDIGGVKFTIPASLAAGTNLSPDSYVSVEEIPQVQNCTSSLFLDQQVGTSTSLTEGNTTYSVGTASDAGAGNRYEETVYAIPGTNPCVAVRYFVHYSAIENYPDGSVKEFDKAALTTQFDAIRRTLVVGQ